MHRVHKYGARRVHGQSSCGGEFPKEHSAHVSTFPGVHTVGIVWSFSENITKAKRIKSILYAMFDYAGPKVEI